MKSSSRKSRIVFFGTPDFAAHILRYLIDREFNIVGIVTRPDRPRGRSQKMLPCAVKETAQTLCPSIPLFQPEKASTDEFVAELRSLNPDLFVVVAYGEIIKTNLLSLPLLGCINVHASLLPKYRGAAPIQRCLMNGEKESGVTIMEMVLQMDAGDMYAVGKVPIPSEMNADELENALSAIACPLLAETLLKIEIGEAKKVAQDPTQVTFAPKITAADRPIDWHRSAEEIHNQIRALAPDSGGQCQVKIGDETKQLTIKRTRVLADQNGEPGSTLSFQKGEWIIACGGGALALLEVQLEGKRALSIEEFIRGVSSHAIKIV